MHLLMHFVFLISTAQAAWHETAHFVLGGERKWDYLTIDAPAHKLYIAHLTKVEVVDTVSGKTVASMPADGAHGVALNSADGVGYFTNGKSGRVSVFDLKTFAVRQQIVAGENPDAIVYDSFSKKVFAFNGQSRNATVIDAKTNQVVGLIRLGAKPEFAVSNGKGQVFVNLETMNALARIDVQINKTIGLHPLAACKKPTGLSIDLKTDRLFVGCSNNLVAILEGSEGRLLKTFTAGKGIDATAFDAKRSLIFASAGDGQLTVLHEKSANEFELVEAVKVPQGARTMAVDAESGKVYLLYANPEFTVGVWEAVAK